MQRRVSLLVLFFFLFQLAGGIHLPKAEAAGDGTSAEPYWNADGQYYEIQNEKQLAGLAELVKNGNTFEDKTINLVANLDLGGQEWTPIGFEVSAAPYNQPFMGIFDGGGYSIFGLKITGEKSYIGLFGTIDGDKAAVRNLTVVSPDVSGEAKVGGLVGCVRNDARVENAAVLGGKVHGTDQNVGGLVGLNNGQISSSYATSEVSGRRYVGGLVGNNSVNETIKGKITSSYATGAVSGTGGNVGGLVGGNANACTITSSYATGTVNGTKDFVGGLVGSNGGTITSSAYDPQGTGQTGAVNGAGNNNVTSIPTKSNDWQNGWTVDNFDTLYKSSDQYYPQIKSFDNAMSTLSVVPVILSGDGPTTGGEDARNLKTPFALLSKDAGGKPLAWRIERTGAVLAISGDAESGQLVVSPDATGKSFDLYATNGSGREKMFRLTTSNDLTATNNLSAAGDAPRLTAVSPDPVMTSMDVIPVEVGVKDADVVSVDVSGPTGISNDIGVTNGSFDYLFSSEGAYTVTVTMWKKAGDSYVYSLGAGTITAEAPLYELIVSADAGGIADESSNRKHKVGTQISLTASADQGYRFVKWIAAGVTLNNTTQNPVSFTMPYSNVNLTATFESGSTPPPSGDPDPGPDDSQANVYPIKITGIIDGIEYTAEKQPDGTYLIVFPAGTDPEALKNLSLTFKLSDGTTVVRSGDFLEGPVTFPSGAGGLTSKVTIEARISQPNTAVGSLITADASRCLVYVVYNADGTVAFEIRLPIAGGFTPTTLRGLYVYLSAWLTNLSLACVNEDESIVPLATRDADAPYLRIKGTAASKSALESATLSGLTYWLKENTTEYKQAFDPALKISDMQITYTNDPPSDGGSENETETDSSGGGCDAGFGVVILLAAGLAIKKKRAITDRP